MKIEKVVDRYNDIMCELGCEHRTIGTSLSEGTEGWGMDEMLCSMMERRETFFECGHVNCDLKQDNPKEWRRLVNRIDRFINRFAEKNVAYCY